MLLRKGAVSSSNMLSDTKPSHDDMLWKNTQTAKETPQNGRAGHISQVRLVGRTRPSRVSFADSFFVRGITIGVRKQRRQWSREVGEVPGDPKCWEIILSPSPRLVASCPSILAEKAVTVPLKSALHSGGGRTHRQAYDANGLQCDVPDLPCECFLPAVRCCYGGNRVLQV